MVNLYSAFTVSVIIALMLLCGCNMIPPVQPEHSTLLTSEKLHLEGLNTQTINPSWWEQFSDKQLSQLIQQGRTRNLTLKQAQQKILLASQQVSLAESGDEPSINLNASAAVIGTNTQSFNVSDADYSALGMLMPSFSYQFNFFGKHEASIAEAKDQQGFYQAQKIQTQLAISTSIASSYFDFQNSYRISKTLKVLLDEIHKQDDVINNQIRRGLASKADSYLNQGNIDTLKGQLLTARTREQLAKNQLALYLAKTPEQLGALLTPNAQVITPLAQVTSIPMGLLGRRADIIASKWLVEANSQNIKQAKAAYYPDFNLMVMGVFQKLSNLNPADLFLGNASVAVNLPLYDGGARDSNYASANIQYDQAVIQYNQTVLTSVKQVSDALTNLQEAQQQQVLSQSSVKHHHQAYTVLQHRYKRGLSSFSDMNNARMQWQQQVISQTDTNSLILQSQLQLILALGGGYQQPSETQPTSNSTQIHDD